MLALDMVAENPPHLRPFWCIRPLIPMTNDKMKDKCLQNIEI